MSNAPTVREMGANARTLLEAKKDTMLRMLPEKLGRDRFMELMLAVVSTPAIAECSPASIVAAGYACARLGLTPDPILGHIYIIPRAKIASVQVGYKGLIELARRSGIVRSVGTEVVYEDEPFRYWSDEKGKHILHEPQLSRAPDAIIRGVYCVAEMAGGGWPQVEVMAWADVVAVRDNFSASGSPAWKNNLVEMGKKTVIRRASKLWPQSAELAQAVHWDEQAERGEAQSLPPVPGDMPTVIAEQPRRRSLKAPVSAPDNEPPPYDDSDIPAGGVDAQSFDVDDAPAKAPAPPKRPAAKKPAPVDGAPTDPKDLADVFTEGKTKKELRQYIDTEIALRPAIVKAAMATAQVLNLDHGSEAEIGAVAWNLKYAAEGGLGVGA